jgi:hypothetical protein
LPEPSSPVILRCGRQASVNARNIGGAKLPRGVTAAVRDAAETVWRLDAVNEPGQFSPARADRPSTTSR